MASRVLSKKSTKRTSTSKVLFSKLKGSDSGSFRNSSKQPVVVEGIEFDALISEDKTYSAKIPQYPIEDGFSVSDTIILEPMSLQLSLYVSNTPVSFLHRFGTAKDRVNRICEMLENLWLSRKLVKVVTRDTIYTDMGITSISIKKSATIGYAREVSMKLEKIRITKKQTTSIPDDIFKSGETMANAGVASTTSAKLSSERSGNASKSNTTETMGQTQQSSKSSTQNASKNGNDSSSKKGKSILYGVANGLKLM